METSNNQFSLTRKAGLWLLTVVLWLATVGLGVLALIILQQGIQVRGALLLLQNNEMGLTARSGWLRSIRYASWLLGGLVWLSMVVGGMEFHFKYTGKRRSMRVFAWTIGIELALIGLGILLQIA